MPEGDTVHKLAAELSRRLAGRELAGGRVRGRPDFRLAGRRVEDVDACGKHLFVRLESDLWIRSHLGMHGAWHRYAPGERWRKPTYHAAVVLEAEGDVLVCFHPGSVEIGDAASLERFRLGRRLGPDLVNDAPSGAVLAARADAFLAPDAPLVDLLLDQRVACGVGNVYKSELLFLHGRSPLTPRSALDAAALESLYADAHRLLRANLHPGRRATRAAREAEPLWVYGRAGCPCLRCGTEIVTARLGRGRRDTSWCPRCQPDGSRLSEVARPPRARRSPS